MIKQIGLLLFSLAFFAIGCTKESDESYVLKNTARLAGNHTWTGTAFWSAGSISRLDTSYTVTFDQTITVITDKKIVFGYDTLLFSSYNAGAGTITYASNHHSGSFNSQNDTIIYNYKSKIIYQTWVEFDAGHETMSKVHSP